MLLIRIHLTVMDPDPYWECGSGSRSMKIDQNLQFNLVPASKKGFCTFVGMLCYLLPTYKYIFM
jgi:hypothetical protein